MRIFLYQTWGMITKDLRQWRRDRQAMIGALALPLVLMIFAAILFGFGGDEWPIGLVVEGNGPEAQRLAQTIENLQGDISPYFRIITRDAATAKELIEAGRLHMVITIPSDFDTRLSAGETPVIHTQVFNIATDVTKNVRLRLERAIQEYLAAEDKAPVTIAQYKTRAEDVWRRAFIAGGGLVLALLIGASLNTAIIVAREWERNTIKELRLAPAALAAMVTGKLIAGLVATAMNIGVALVVAVVFFGLRIPPDRWLALLGIGFGVAIAAAGIGLGVGAALRDYRTVQPLLGVVMAGSFFASGGYGSVSTLPPAVRTFNMFWPPAYVFETMQAVMHMAVLPDLSSVSIALPLAAGLGVAFGAWMVRRAM